MEARAEKEERVDQVRGKIPDSWVDTEVIVLVAGSQADDSHTGMLRALNEHGIVIQHQDREVGQLFVPWSALRTIRQAPERSS